jgi:hypothetical protein
VTKTFVINMMTWQAAWQMMCSKICDKKIHHKLYGGGS